MSVYLAVQTLRTAGVGEEGGGGGATKPDLGWVSYHISRQNPKSRPIVKAIFNEKS